MEFTTRTKVLFGIFWVLVVGALVFGIAASLTNNDAGSKSIAATTKQSNSSQKKTSPTTPKPAATPTPTTSTTSSLPATGTSGTVVLFSVVTIAGYGAYARRLRHQTTLSVN
ncbi:MAG: hypothetical protein JWN38_897 [Candidatus Saccharibacteria bacterium]|nr:hypothetical protein [Candidatus Saccharibacteria bacterium]